MGGRILLVDDEEDFLDFMAEFLTEEGYEVTCASSGAEALGHLAAEPFDLLLSDINMPGMKGFELLERAAEGFPNVKRALMTAYDVRDYLDLAKNHNVGNIITKTTPFNFEETAALVHDILSEEVFGLDRYVDGPVQSRTITSTAQIEPVIKEVIDSMPDKMWRRKFRHGLAEIVVNAVYYGARQERGDDKSGWKLDVELSPDEAIILCWAIDSEKAGVAVTDQKGRLSKKEVLFWLERNTARAGEGLAPGFFDTHGKGLFITRETNDRFIVNIKRNVRTEIIIINYHEGLYDGHRPLWIHEM
jgi:CheY-like chemotaxis protein